MALATAGIAAYLEGRFADARKLCERAEGTFRDRCIGAAWELDNTQLFLLWSLCYLGEWSELAARIPRAIHDAEARGDRYAATSLRTGTLTLHWLAAARIREARPLLEVTDLSVEDVAARSGLGSAVNLRVHLARDAGTTPTAYRATYQGRGQRP